MSAATALHDRGPGVGTGPPSPEISLPGPGPPSGWPSWPRWGTCKVPVHEACSAHVPHMRRHQLDLQGGRAGQGGVNPSAEDGGACRRWLPG